jgi:dephospho-CoA kinase
VRAGAAGASSDSTPDPRRAAFIGLTGGIAAGKSEALAVLDGLGAATLSSDALVHELLSSSEVRDRLVERWGAEIAPRGEVDRARVGAVVFERPEELAWLEQQLHPRVGSWIAAWRESLPAGVEVAVVEVPLLFETGMDAAFDATVAVIADDASRAERAGLRGTDSLEARESRQLTQDEKAARATHVVRNEGTLDQLRSELARIYPDLREAARSPA